MRNRRAQRVRFPPRIISSTVATPRPVVAAIVTIVAIAVIKITLVVVLTLLIVPALLIVLLVARPGRLRLIW